MFHFWQLPIAFRLRRDLVRNRELWRVMEDGEASFGRMGSEDLQAKGGPSYAIGFVVNDRGRVEIVGPVTVTLGALPSILVRRMAGRILADTLADALELCDALPAVG